MPNYSQRDMKFFWWITFDVQEVNGIFEPRLMLDMELWDLNSVIRAAYLSEPLDRPTDSKPGNPVQYTANGAIFQDQYLICEVDLIAAARSLYEPIFGPNSLVDLEPGSVSIRGENVSIVVDVELGDNGRNQNLPLFIFPQYSQQGQLITNSAIPVSARDEVALLEVIDSDGTRTIEWTVSGHTYRPDELFMLASPAEGRHRIRVRQDTVPWPTVACSLFGIQLPPGICAWISKALGLNSFNGVRDGFEFLVGGLQLGNAVEAVSSAGAHYFDVQKQKFYIGGAPNKPHGLTGVIRRLEFDPNNSCVRCTSGVGGGGVTLRKE